MSIVTEYMLRCDECGDVDTGTASHNAKTAREEARRQGWKRVGKLDLCPDCYQALLESKPSAPPF